MNDRSQNPPAAGSRPAQTEAKLRLLVETGLLLARERSLDGIVQAALDAGLQLAEAAWGAFVEAPAEGQGPLGRPAKVVGAGFGGLTAELEDMALQALAGRTVLAQDGRLLAVPVSGRGPALGAMLYGRSGSDGFAAEDGPPAAMVAAQAGMAIENAKLGEVLSREMAMADAARSAERDAAERGRRETERRLRQALDAGQLGTWAWDRATDALDFDARASELFGTEPGQALTRTFMRERAVLSEDQPTVLDSLRAALESGGTYRAEYRITRPGGGAHDVRWIAAAGIATFKEGTAGEITGMIGTVQDITARKMQEATLRQSEKLAATGRLAATIAHEINNPLEAVTNLIFLAKTDPEVPAQVQKLLETADAELMRVSQIAQQTLGFYRDTTRPVEINLNELLEGVVDLFSRRLGYAKLQCTLDLEPKLSVFGLHGEIRQVFSNLLVNAIDACQPASFSAAKPLTIRIRGRVKRAGGREGVSVLVCDPGSGIHADVRPKLFSPFVSSKPSRGTGLGLWVTRGIVEKHGGTVMFSTSTRTPSGTVFRVFLPQKIANPEIFSSPQSKFLQ